MSNGMPEARRQVLTLTVAALPIVAISVAYVLGALREQIPLCVPFLEGCTSISATGRHAPGSFVFKPALLLQAALLLLLWQDTVRRLRANGNAVGSRLLRAVLVLGAVSSAALVVYTLTLGSKLALYEFMRRFGIYFYFLGLVLTQWCVTLAYRRAGTLRGWPRIALPFAVLLPFLLGLVNLVAKPLLDDPDPLENAIEWCAALVMQAWFLVLLAADRRAPAQPPR